MHPLQYYDYTQIDDDFFDKVVGFDFNKNSLRLPLLSVVENLIVPTDKGHDELVDLSWNFAAQNSLMAFGSGNFYVPEGEFARLINAMFFDSDNDGLRVRHIKWMDFIPLSYDDTGSKYDSIKIDLGIYTHLVKPDANYIYPLPSREDYKYSKLPQINRFIELAGNKRTNETDITSFLEVETNKFILTMAFFGKDIYSQLLCEWQSEERNAIKPDFFVLQPDGYANIVEFKLPDLKTSPVVGRLNRESFSAELNSYISQTRVYEEYFDDPNNRRWFESKFGFKVHKPKRILVVGRRWSFSNDEWRGIISDFRNIEIKTYDDLVDGVVAQFYL